MVQQKRTIRLRIFGSVLLCKLGLCLVDQKFLAVVFGSVFSKLVGGRYGGLAVEAVDNTRGEC